MRRRSGATRPRSVPYHRSIKAVWIVVPKLPQAQLLDKAAGPTEDHASADVDDLPGLVTDLDDLRLEQVGGSHKAWFGLAAHFPTTPTSIHHPQDLEKRGGIGLPPIRQKEGDRLGTRDDLGDQSGRHLLRARADVDPQQKPATHGQGGMAPCHLAWTQFRMGFIPLDAGHVHRTDSLAMVGLSALGSDVLHAMHRLEINGTKIGGVLITDAPPLTLQQA